MITALRRWRQRRILKTQAIPEGLWRDALESLPFLAMYRDSELARLREKCVLFLAEKSIVGARGHQVTPRQRVVIALQACALVLNLDLWYYEGWENVVVYPDEFVPGWEWEDEAGVVHTNDEPMAGEAMEGGPVILSWADVEASQDWEAAGMNLAIHEFAHKIDLRDGAPDGCPPMPSKAARERWLGVLEPAYRAFREQVIVAERFGGEPPWLDAYGATAIDEFFAVACEAYFVNRERFSASFATLVPLFDGFFGPRR